MPTKTLKVRVKDKHAAQLRAWSWATNRVWNYINDLSMRSIKERGKFLSAYDIHPYTKGAGKELGLHSQTLQCIASEYATRRKQFKKWRLRWRVSGGAKRVLGWVPINTGASSWKDGQVFHNGHYFKVWDSFGLSQYKFRSASFNEDARGRWYFNVVVDAKDQPSKGQDKVGIDLGLKTVATCSDGTELQGRWFRSLQLQLAKAQRARRKKQARAIHAKIRNKRQDDQHKFSRELVNRCGEIYVGNVSSSKLVKTKMAKSTLDAGWASLKQMILYKCDHAGIIYKEVNEAYSTRACSECGSLSGPQGIRMLSVRQWDCGECGSSHGRDVNAARNILIAGLGH